MSAPTAPATSRPRRPRYADPTACPSCAARLHRPICARCGADLTGELGRRIWAASVAVDSWLDERERLLTALRAETTARRRATPTDAPTRVARLEQPPRPVQVAARHGAISVQHVLVGVGALLLATAAVIFLFFSWGFLGLTGRAVIVATGTLAVLTASFVARRVGLAATSEAVGALGVVLVLLDVWAARETGLLATGMGSPAYAALGTFLAAVLLGAWGGRTGVRAGTAAAACLAPAAPVLAGLAFATSRPDDAFAWLAAGLLAGSAVALVRGLPVLPHLVLERRVLAGGTAVLLLLALVPVIGARAQTGSVAAALLLAGLAAVSGGSALLADGARTATAWSAGFGVLVAGSVVMTASAVSGPARLVALPAAAAVVAVALRLWSPPRALRGLATRTAARAAVAVTALAALPAVLTWLLGLFAVPAALVRPWTLHAGDPVSAPALFAGAAVPAAGEAAAAVLAIVALAAAAAGWWLGGGRRAALTVALTGAGAAATTVWLAPQVPVWVAVTGLAVTAVLAAILAETVSPAVTRPALVTAWTAGTLAVLLSWTVEPLALAATAVGAAALVLARLRWPLLGAVLLAAAASAVLVDVGAAVLAWAPNATPSDVAAAVTVAASVLAGGAALIPAAVLRPAATHTDREAVLVVAAVGAGLGIALPAAVLSSVPVAPLATALTAALVVAGDPRGLLRAAARGVAGGAGTAVAALLAWTLGEKWWPVPGLVGAAAVVTCAAVVAGLLGGAIAARHPRRDGGTRAVRLAVEWTSVGVALLVLTAALGTAHLWVVLALLSAGCLAVASAPDRRSVSWAALLLATGALWERLHHGEVALVEAYTLPPAVMLLGVAVARRRWREQDAPMLGGAALAVLPTALAAPVGPIWRPWVLLVLAAGLVAAAAARALPLTRLPLGLAAAAVTGVWLRSVLDVAAGVPPERWSLPAAAVAALIGLVTARGRGWTLVPALAMAAGPTLVTGGTVRVLAVLALGAAASITGALHARPASRASALTGAGVATGALAAVTGLHGGTRPVELLTVPLAAVLLALGVLHLRRAAVARTWPALGPGLALLLLPVLLLAAGDGGGWRVAGLAAAATAVVVTGVRLRWQAPLVLGSAVLCTHALVQTWPALTALYAVAPRWASLGMAGALLLALGARYERRLDDVRAVRARVTAMR